VLHKAKRTALEARKVNYEFDRVKKIDDLVISAAIALGIEGRRRSDRAIASEISIRTPKGLTKAWALLDMGAENNFIDQTWAKTHLPDTQISIRRVHALDGHHITSVGSSGHVTLSVPSHVPSRSSSPRQ
jgi:hypothetical protein